MEEMKEYYKSCRFIKFPNKVGMAPDNWLFCKYLFIHFIDFIKEKKKGKREFLIQNF